MTLGSKLHFLIIFCLCTVCGISQNVDFFEKTDIYLRQIVQSGKVNYQKAIDLESDKNHLISLIKEFPTSSSNTDSLTAFYINAYNLFVIFDIVEYYPKWSVKAIPDFFDIKKWELGDQLVSLNEIEAKLDLIGDPRIHFAIVCGAKDCPKIQSYPYRPNNLNTQLENVTRNFINDLHNVVEYDNKLELNKIFEWNELKFSSNTSLKEFINNYRYQKLSVTSAIEFKAYDWSLNEYQEILQEQQNTQRFYYSKIYEKGQYELHLFNNYYTAKDVAQNENDFDSRSNFFTMWGQFLYGINDNLNVGFDIRLRSVNQNFRENTSSWEGLKFKNDGLTSDSTGNLFYSRTGFTGIGPKVKYQPFKNIPFITMQHTLLFPMGSDLEGNLEQGFIDWNNPTLFNQLFYDQDLGSDISFFAEVGLTVESLSSSLFRRKPGRYQLSLPINLIFSYFMDERSTIYTFINATPRWFNEINENLNLSRRSDPYSQLGLGYKYFFTDDLQMEFLYTFFSTNETGRQARTLNFGIRYYGR